MEAFGVLGHGCFMFLLALFVVDREGPAEVKDGVMWRERLLGGDNVPHRTPTSFFHAAFPKDVPLEELLMTQVARDRRWGWHRICRF